MTERINFEGKLKFERTKQMCPLKKEIISYLFNQIARRDRDRWWQYKGEFNYQGITYLLECECRWDNQVFSYRNMHIEHKQVEIDLTDKENEFLVN